MRDPWSLALESIRHGQPAVLVTVVDATGSVPGKTGAKLVASPIGLAGTVGGGVAEREMVNIARAETVKPGIHTYTHAGPGAASYCAGVQTFAVLPLGSRDLAVLEAITSTLAAGGCGVLRLSAAGVSFTSGLKVPTSFVRREESWLFAETIGTLETLTIVGGGHVALALSRVAAALPLRIVVLDDRPELSTMLENQWAHETRVISYDDVVQHVPDGDLSYVVIMTHEHANDEAVLGRLATRSYRYLGMMGSPAKVRQLFSNLVAAGLPAESLEQVHSPIGIPIHSHTPEEIAISIAAEIVKVRNSGS